MNCERVSEEDVAEQYLQGQLSEPEQQAFERHYFQCPRCFEQLETYRAMRQALAEPYAEAPPRSRPHWTWAAAAAGVVLAVALGYLLPRTFITSSSGVTPPSEASGAGTSSGPAAAPGSGDAAPGVAVASLTELARVLPPGYTPSVLRGVSDDESRRFRQGMNRYLAGDYAGARIRLEAGATRNPNAPHVAFYLGVCRLLTDDVAGAIAELQRTIALGESPFLEDARFYLAKALLRRGDPEGAAAELEKTVALHGDREEEAGDLLQKVEAFRENRRK